jgi:inosine-uridine nucleoside N-ribohydrolase
VAALLAGFVMMGGDFGQDLPATQQVEWNIAGDPLAADIVYKANVRLHRSLGLNVTQQIVMPAEEVRKRFTAPLLRPVLDMAEIWFAQFYPSITFHDPLAAATVFAPDLCAYQQGIVSVDIAETPGRTIWQPGGPNAPHQVAVTVDVERYFQHFFDVIG